MSKNDMTMPGINWRKSSRSGQQGECVEVAAMPGAIAFRDSKNSAGAMLRIDLGSFERLVEQARNGELDL